MTYRTISMIAGALADTSNAVSLSANDAASELADFFEN